MVIIDQFRISDNGNKLYLDAHVIDIPELQGVYIDKVYILNRKKISERDPSVIEDILENDCIYMYPPKDSEEKWEKEISLILTPTNFNENYPQSEEAKSDPCEGIYVGSFSRDLFYVYITVKTKKGETVNLECLPCSLGRTTTIGVTFDENMLHQRVMNYVKQLADDCTVPQGFADFILLWNAFKSSVETEHYLTANKFYDMLFDNRVNTGYTQFTGGGGCGCHG